MSGQEVIEGDLIDHLRHPGIGTERYWMNRAASEIARLRAGHATFCADECYELFLAVDDKVRRLRGQCPELNAVRERLLPFYSARHKG